MDTLKWMPNVRFKEPNKVCLVHNFSRIFEGGEMNMHPIFDKATALYHAEVPEGRCHYWCYWLDQGGGICTLPSCFPGSSAAQDNGSHIFSEGYHLIYFGN
jgi:hypothetical protein